MKVHKGVHCIGTLWSQKRKKLKVFDYLYDLEAHLARLRSRYFENIILDPKTTE